MTRHDTNKIRGPKGFVGLTHAAIGVADLSRAVDFYVNHLGFSSYYSGNTDWAMVRMGATTLSLLRQPALAAPGLTEGFHPVHLGITVDSKADVDSTWERLGQTLDVVLSKPKLHRDGSYGFYFQDTEGNNLEIIYIPPIPLDRDFSKRATILMAHGSQDPSWKKPFESVLADVKRHFPKHGWELAFLEEEPSLKNAVESLLKKGNWDKINVLPIFLSAGAHTIRDIPTQVTMLKASHPQLAIEILPPLGLDTGFIRHVTESVLFSIEAANTKA